MADLRTLYPEITPYNLGKLDVGNGHHVYFEESGNPTGIPVFHLHGGPGGGASPKSRQIYNPQKYRIIIHDQRGSGRSTPVGSIADNTLQHLVADIEALRTHLKVETMVVYGTSWGSTLALAYAQAHPQRVKALILGGIFFGSQYEMDFVTKPGLTERFVPHIWRALRDFLPAGQPPMQALNAIVNGPDETLAKQAALHWTRMEWWTGDVAPDAAIIEPALAADLGMLDRVKILAHYAAHDFFLKPDELVANLPRIKHVPITILQGLQDLVTPPQAAFALHEAHQKNGGTSTLHLVPATGHVGTPQMVNKRIEVLDALAV